MADENKCIDDPRPVYACSPSDLTFLLSECHRCFYNKVRRGQRLPRTPMPAVFTAIDRLQRAYFHKKPTASIGVGLPPGVLDCFPSPIASSPYYLDDRAVGVRFRGAIDAGAVFDNGEFGVIDFKTVNPKASHVDTYRHQLGAYAWALENPAPGNIAVGPVSTLGLLCFYPTGLIKLPDGTYALNAQPTWVPIKRSDDLFRALMRLVLGILARPSEPGPGEHCPRCRPHI